MKLPILKESPLFQGLEESRIDELIEHASYATRSFRKGELIAQRNMAYSSLMMILKGSVYGEIEDGETGEPKITDRKTAPQLIAPAFLFGSYNRLPMSVFADEDDTEILFMHRGALFEIMREEMLVMSNFIDIVSNRANYFSKSLYELQNGNQ